MRRCALGLIALALLPDPAFAAGLDGRAFGVVWAVPFVGMLLSIALFPLFAPHFWEHHQGKVAALWALLTVVPLAMTQSPGVALDAVSHREREPRRHHAGRHRRAVGVELERGFVTPCLGAVCPELPAHLRLRASEPEHERLLLRRQPVTAVV